MIKVKNKIDSTLRKHFPKTQQVAKGATHAQPLTSYTYMMLMRTTEKKYVRFETELYDIQ